MRTSLTGSSWLFTKANGIVNAYRWLPWISKATPFERPNHGDPFVTPTSPFVQLTVKTDRKLVIATSGDLVSRSEDGLTQRFEARDVRDVTLTAAPDFKSRSATVGGTRIRYLYRSSTNASATLDAAVDAFRVDSVATITNTSGGPIDRLEFNTAVARLGGLKLGTVQVDGRDVRARVDDQTIVVPLGGVLPAGGRTVVRRVEA